MPLNEAWSYMANGIYRAMPVEVRDKTFVMPMFMEYCVTTKIAPNWMYAVYDALITVRQVYDTAKDDDLIVIGNCDADLKFDAVFNFQDIEEDLPYSDKYVEKLKTIVKDDEKLSSYLVLHEAEESKMPLHNCAATADFLTDYLATDPHLEDIKKEFQKKLKLDKIN